MELNEAITELEEHGYVVEAKIDPYPIYCDKYEWLVDALLERGFEGTKLVDRPMAFYVTVPSPAYGNVMIHYSIKDKTFTISNNKYGNFKSFDEDEIDDIAEYLE